MGSSADGERSFEPALVKKGQGRINSVDDKIISLHTAGLSIMRSAATVQYSMDSIHQQVRQGGRNKRAAAKTVAATLDGGA